MANGTAYAVKTPTPNSPSIASLAGLSAADRQAALSQLSPDDAAKATAQLANDKAEANHAYLARSIRKKAVMPPSGGGINIAYTQGKTFVFEMPSAAGGFAKELIVDIELTVTLDAGTSALYQLNAGAPWTLVQFMDITFGSASQSKLRPYLVKVLDALRGFGRPAGGPTQVIAGQSNAEIQAQMQSSLPVAVGANNWVVRLRIPLTSIHDLHPAGMLPIMASGGNAAKVKMTLPQLYGNDPLDNVISNLSGTGHAVDSVTGTVALTVEYCDGVNLQSVQPLALDLSGEPTAQYAIDLDVTNLQTGSRANKGRISSLLPHYYVVACVVDGVSQLKFATAANILSMELDVDQTGTNKFYFYGAGSDISVWEFYEKIRRTIGQDLDAGIIPWVYAPAQHQYDASNGEGMAVLNMSPGGGWTDINHGYTFSSLPTTLGITKRVETWLVSMNPAGLQLG